MYSLSQLPFNNTFFALGESLDCENSGRFYTAISPQPICNPALVSASTAVAELIGLNPAELHSEQFLKIFSGAEITEGSQPLAMVYSGHQFGAYSPRLGDGRAILLGEVESEHGHFDLQLKGAGVTPYSRFGDGRAVLRSSIREYLCSEAMAGLGIATTRALCVIAGEDEIVRETIEPSAVVCRVSPSHIRFGHFEWLFYQNDHEGLKALADYVIERHFSEFHNHNDKYLRLYQLVMQRTAKMIAHWQAVGFSHGVMNTDNMSILGLTFDYGPFGFMDDFEPGFICNHSDHSGRYAFNQQPQIGLWNLNALGHVFTALVEREALVEVLEDYQPEFVGSYSDLLAKKLGLKEKQKHDEDLAHQWLELMAKHKVDYTNTFRALAQTELASGKSAARQYFPEDAEADKWFSNYFARLQQQSMTDSERKATMDRANPKYILRNYLVQQAIEKAEKVKDFSEVNLLLDLLYQPFNEQPEFENYARPAPDWGKQLEISCSS